LRGGILIFPLLIIITVIITLIVILINSGACSGYCDIVGGCYSLYYCLGYLGFFLYLPLEIEIPLTNLLYMDFFIVYFMYAISIYFFLGALIGFLYGKIKNRKQEVIKK